MLRIGERCVKMNRRDIMHEMAITQLKGLRCHVLLDETLGAPCPCQLCVQIRRIGQTLELDRESMVIDNGSDLSR